MIYFNTNEPGRQTIITTTIGQADYIIISTQSFYSNRKNCPSCSVSYIALIPFR
jgi:hypothetical protein